MFANKYLRIPSLYISTGPPSRLINEVLSLSLSLGVEGGWEGWNGRRVISGGGRYWQSCDFLLHQPFHHRLPFRKLWVVSQLQPNKQSQALRSSLKSAIRWNLQKLYFLRTFIYAIWTSIIIWISRNSYCMSLPSLANWSHGSDFRLKEEIPNFSEANIHRFLWARLNRTETVDFIAYSRNYIYCRIYECDLMWLTRVWK